MSIPIIYQDPTTKVMFATTGLRTTASPPTRSYRWYFDDVLQVSMTADNFTPLFAQSGVGVRCEVGIGGSWVSSEPTVITDWLRQMPDSAFLYFDPNFTGIVLEGPAELGSSYPMDGWVNQGSSGANAVAGTNAPTWSPGDALGDFAGIPFVGLDATDWFTLGNLAGLGPKRTDFWVMHQSASGTRRLIQPPSNQIIGATSSILAAYNNGAYRNLEALGPTIPRTFALTVHMDTSINGYLGNTLTDNSPQPYVDETVSGTSGALFGTVAGTSCWGGRCYFAASYDRALTAGERGQAWDFLSNRFPMLF